MSLRRVGAGVASAAALGALAWAGAMDPWEGAASALAYAAAWTLRGRTGGGRSERALELALLLAAVLFGVDVLLHGVLSAMLRLVVILQVILWLRKDAEVLAIVLLSLLHMVAAVALSDAVGVGGFLLAFVSGTLLAVLESGWGFRRITALAGAWLAAWAGLFVILPRPVPWGSRMRVGVAGGLDTGALAGLSDGVVLGAYARIRNNPRVVARVELDEATAAAGVEPLYLRAYAFDAFDGREWRRRQFRFSLELPGRTVLSLSNGRVRLPVRGRRVRLGPGAAAFRQRVYAEPTLSPMLLAAWRPVELEAEVPWVEVDAHGALSLEDPPLKGMAYTVWSERRPMDTTRSSPLVTEDPEWSGIYEQLPPGGERFRALALSLADRAETRHEAMLRFMAHLREFRYTLSEEFRTLDQFLFEARQGHCEYFASAAAVMARSLGMPARVVNGFLADEYNAAGRFFTVRASDAHAWVEVYEPLEGWVAYDPTPSGGEGLAASRRVLQRTPWMMSWMQTLDLAWKKHVIGYDREAQGALFRATVEAAWRGGPWTALAALAGWGVRRAWRRRKRASAERPGAAAFFFGQALRSLADAGWKPQPHQTAWEFADDLARAQRGFDPLRELTRLYYAVRFGYRTLSREEEAAAEKALQALAARLGGEPGLRRRWP